MAFEHVPKLNKHGQVERRYVRFQKLGGVFRIGEAYWEMLGNPSNVRLSFDPDTGQALVQASDNEFDQKVTGIKKSQLAFNSKLLARRMGLLLEQSQYLDAEWSDELNGLLIFKRREAE